MSSEGPVIGPMTPILMGGSSACALALNPDAARQKMKPYVLRFCIAIS
jgi:hypothetical protein